MMPTFARPGRRGARAVGADESGARRLQERDDAQHVQRRDALGDAEDRADAGRDRLQHRVRRARSRNVDDARVGAGLTDGLGDGVEDRHRAVDGAQAALAGRHAGDDLRAPRRDHLAGVELALAAGDALDEQPRVAADEDAHAGATRGRCRGDGLLGGFVEAAGGLEGGGAQDLGRLGGVGADDAHDHRHVALLLGARLDQAARHLVAAGDAAEDVDQDGAHVGVVEDEPHRRRDLVGPRAAADVQEVRGLAAGALDEVHRGHRQAGAVDHAADVAVELDEADALGAGRDVGRVLLVEVAHLLQLGMAEERRVVERDLGVEALQRQRLAAVGAAGRGRRPAD